MMHSVLSYQELIHLYAVSSLLNRPIQSYYPPTSNEYLTGSYTRIVCDVMLNITICQICGLCEHLHKFQPQLNNSPPPTMLCYPPSPITPRVVRGEIDLTEDFPPLRKTDMTKPDTNTRGRQHKLKMKKQNNKKMLSLHQQDRINITEHAPHPDSSHTNTHDTPASDPPHTDTLNQNTPDSHTVDTSQHG